MKENKKTLILNTALSLFAEKGFENTNMRELAATCGLGLGSFYYYFNSKSTLVMAWYKKTAEQTEQSIPKIKSSTRLFSKRFEMLLEQKFSELREHRALCQVLARSAVDFKDPLSPFSEETRSLRLQAKSDINLLVEGSDFSTTSSMKTHIINVLWLYQMVAIMLWANDSSNEQFNSKALISKLTPILLVVLKLTSVPIIKNNLKTSICLVEKLVGIEDDEV